MLRGTPLSTVRVGHPLAASAVGATLARAPLSVMSRGANLSRVGGSGASGIAPLAGRLAAPVTGTLRSGAGAFALAGQPQSSARSPHLIGAGALATRAATAQGSAPLTAASVDVAAPILGATDAFGDAGVGGMPPPSGGGDGGGGGGGDTGGGMVTAGPSINPTGTSIPMILFIVGGIVALVFISKAKAKV
jgi:hypothetical protein